MQSLMHLSYCNLTLIFRTAQDFTAYEYNFVLELSVVNNICRCISWVYFGPICNVKTFKTYKNGIAIMFVRCFSCRFQKDVQWVNFLAV